MASGPEHLADGGRERLTPSPMKTSNAGSEPQNIGSQRPLKVTCFLPGFNAGETTRGIELCRALAAGARERHREVAIRLAYNTAHFDYEAQIVASGFEAHRLSLHLDEATVSSIMMADHHAAELISDLAQARQFIQALIDDIVASRPDLVLCGFVPPAGIAAQIVRIPAVLYLPFPAYRPWVRRHLLRDIPDDLDNAILSAAPPPLRRLLASAVSSAMFTQGIFKQPTFAAAGHQLGWQAQNPDLFTMFDSPLQLVTDLPAFYEGQDIGPKTKVTGPVFSVPPDVEPAPEILRMFSPGPRNRVFVSMGSSGEKPYLLAAIQALTTMPVRAVVVVAPRICSLADVRQSVPIPPHVFLTDSFVPAHQVNAMADAAVIHGGQGTVQTAATSGTPIVGVGMQAEQSTNLDNIVRRGTGIRIPKRQWNPQTIRRALRQVFDLPSFQENAARLKRDYDAVDGPAEAARAIWEFLGSL